MRIPQGVLIFLALLIFSSRLPVLAQTYFEFFPARFFVLENEKFRVNLFYSLKNAQEKEFLVRPVSENLGVMVLNENAGEWVRESDLWTKMPVLSKALYIKFPNAKFITTNLHFEILDTVEHKMYLTSVRKIWGKGVYLHYIEKVNSIVSRHVKITE